MTEHHNIEAEQQLLGAILVDNDRLSDVADVLRAEHFFDPVHARIFEVASSRIRAKHIATPVSLKTAMESDAGLKELGGPAYLARLAASSVSGSACAHYADLVIDQYNRRRLAESLADGQLALSEGVDTREVYTRLQHAVISAPDTGAEPSLVSLMSAMTSAVKDANAAYQGDTVLMQTGIPSLDRILKGLAPGDYCLVGGATSMGKTATAIEIAVNVAKSGGGVVFSSLEMMPADLSVRIAAAESRVKYAELRDAGAMEPEDFQRWVQGAQATSELPIHITPRHIRDVPAIHAACERARRQSFPECGLSLVVIDYAQLLRSGQKGRYEQMTEVSVQLKTLAGMLGVPIVVLVQLSRDIAKREDKRPQLSDIKESGQFENDADQVILCHRPEYWLARQGPLLDRHGKVTDDARADWEADLAEARNIMELHVRKNRHGQLGVARAGFHAPTNRFWDLSKGDAE